VCKQIHLGAHNLKECSPDPRASGFGASAGSRYHLPPATLNYATRVYSAMYACSHKTVPAIYAKHVTVQHFMTKYTAVAQSADCLTSPDSGCQFANAPSHVPSQPVRSGRTSGTFRNIGKTTSELAALRQQFDGQMVGTLG
jgi:hypothetical protein